MELKFIFNPFTRYVPKYRLTLFKPKYKNTELVADRNRGNSLKILHCRHVRSEASRAHSNGWYRCSWLWRFDWAKNFWLNSFHETQFHSKFVWKEIWDHLKPYKNIFISSPCLLNCSRKYLKLWYRYFFYHSALLRWT